MNKIITICGSMNVKDAMIKAAKELEDEGYTVYLPDLEEQSDYASMTAAEQTTTKHTLIIKHLEKIKKADAILVVNAKQKNIDGYIGANSFLEMGFALCLQKKIFLLHEIPEQPNKVEIMGMLPHLLHGTLSSLKI